MEKECELHECEGETFTCQRGSPTPYYHESFKDRSWSSNKLILAR